MILKRMNRKTENPKNWGHLFLKLKQCGWEKVLGMGAQLPKVILSSFHHSMPKD
jgi:hypothetical protein